MFELAIWVEFCWECIDAEVQMGELNGSPRGIPSGDLSGGGEYERQKHAYSKIKINIECPWRRNLIKFLTSHELHNSSMMPPGCGRLVGLKEDFTSLSGKVKSISSLMTGDSIRLSPMVGS